LDQPMALDPSAPWLMRCDRVDFEPGGVALPHRHRGGGIRCLVAGELEVTVDGAPPRLVRPGEAWFESGREPVLAKASPSGPTAFVRVSILPREIRGKSSIEYVDPQDATRGRPRRYTVWVDEPIGLP
ncbi:MAG TPA: cupin domain-containing protein, partial [Candidatus Tectomicrobia bacterium]|nr:cupin domain-containing protein [Candidatus Tectomicrobia bacterium]